MSTDPRPRYDCRWCGSRPLKADRETHTRYHRERIKERWREARVVRSSTTPARGTRERYLATGQRADLDAYVAATTQETRLNHYLATGRRDDLEAYLATAAVVPPFNEDGLSEDMAKSLQPARLTPEEVTAQAQSSLPVRTPPRKLAIALITVMVLWVAWVVCVMTFMGGTTPGRFSGYSPPACVTVHSAALGRAFGRWQQENDALLADRQLSEHQVARAAAAINLRYLRAADRIGHRIQREHPGQEICAITF